MADSPFHTRSMPFSKFTNPYQDPANVPKEYCKHPTIGKLFRADGTYFRPLEDPVTVWAIKILETEYSVPLDVMRLELSTLFAASTGSKKRDYQGRADLVIVDDRFTANDDMDIAFIMVEAMEPGKKFEGTDLEGWNDHYDRLKAYMSASPSARYAILTSGNHTIIYLRDLDYPRSLQPIPETALKKYESAKEAAVHSPYKVIFNPANLNGEDLAPGLEPLTRQKFREVLGDTRSGCHAILRDNEGLQPQEAVDAMVKFLFAKWYDEYDTVQLVKNSQESRAYVFSVSTDTDPERLLTQVRNTFEKAKQWERDTLSEKFGSDLSARLAFNEADVLQFKPHTTVEIVKRLQRYSLRKSSADVKGGVFEDFLSKTFRDDLGQYFTPTPVINLMVGILQPTVDDYVGDPACGSARMLTHVLDYVRKQEYARAVAANSGSEEGIDREEPTPEFVTFQNNYLFGAEYSRNVMHIARVNTLMNGARYADLKVMDSLEKLGSVTGGMMEGLPDCPGFYPEGLTMILTNPPFGSKVTNKAILQDFAVRDGVTKKNGKLVNSVPQEVAFINRCLEFLAPGGKLGIVVPDGVLANTSTQDVRNWILRWAKLRAVISLPQATFSPYGAGVKSSVLFLEKRKQPLTTEGQLELSQIERVLEEEYEYQVYMARIDDIGYDATGRLKISEEQAASPPEVQETISDFADKVGWRA